MTLLPIGTEEQATGCQGASSYRNYAETRGFNFIEVLNWCSSAGDWEFIVSQDGAEWFVLFQTNNYPRPGFTHEIDTNKPYYGTAEEVLEQIAQEYS